MVDSASAWKRRLRRRGTISLRYLRRAIIELLVYILPPPSISADGASWRVLYRETDDIRGARQWLRYRTGSTKCHAPGLLKSPPRRIKLAPDICRLRCFSAARLPRLLPDAAEC